MSCASRECGKPEYHEYQLYLTVEGIEHSRIKTRSPQSNGICERFNRTIQNEFYAVAFRKKLYQSIDQMQPDLDEWMQRYNNERTHSGKFCFGKTPAQTSTGSKHLAESKLLDKFSTLEVPGEAESGSAGEQPDRNNLANGDVQEGVQQTPSAPFSNISLSLMPQENASRSLRQSS